MKKVANPRQLILSGVLVVLLIYYVIDSGMLSNGSVVKPSKNLTKVITGDENVSELDDIHRIINLASVVEINWEKDWEDDPFFYVSPESLESKSKGGLLDDIFGTVSEAANISSLTLTGISWHGNSGYAIINGQIVQLDDVIGGYRVEKIAINHVILKQGSQTVRLTLDDR